MLQNIRCFIVLYVIIVLDSCRKQANVFQFFALNKRLEKLDINLPFNQNLFFIHVHASSFIDEIISSLGTKAKWEDIELATVEFCINNVFKMDNAWLPMDN